MNNSHYKSIIMLGIVCAIILYSSSYVFCQSMYMEERRSGGMFTGAVMGTKDVTTFGAGAGLSMASVIDLSVGIGSVNHKGNYDDIGYHVFEIMIHPLRFDTPHEYSLAPFFSCSHTQKTDFAYATNTTTFGIIGFYRFKLTDNTYLMLEPGVGVSRAGVDGYGFYDEHNVMEGYLEAELFGKVSDQTMLTVNPAVHFIEDGDTAYGIGIGVIILGKKRISQ